MERGVVLIDSMVTLLCNKTSEFFDKENNTFYKNPTTNKDRENYFCANMLLLCRCENAGKLMNQITS